MANRGRLQVFRKEACERFSRTIEPTEILSISRPLDWLVFTVAGVSAVIGLLWVFYAKIPLSIDVKGVIADTAAAGPVKLPACSSPVLARQNEILLQRDADKESQSALSQSASNTVQADERQMPGFTEGCVGATVADHASQTRRDTKVSSGSLSGTKALLAKEQPQGIELNAVLLISVEDVPRIDLGERVVLSVERGSPMLLEGTIAQIGMDEAEDNASKLLLAKHDNLVGRWVPVRAVLDRRRPVDFGYLKNRPAPTMSTIPTGTPLKGKIILRYITPARLLVDRLFWK